MPSLIDALNHSEGRRLIESIEDFLGSTNGAARYESEIRRLGYELKAITGFSYCLPYAEQPYAE